MSKKQELIIEYAESLVNSMDLKTLEQFAFECLYDNFSKYTYEELVAEFKEYAGHLID